MFQPAATPQNCAAEAVPAVATLRAGRDDLKPRMVNGRIDREQELIEYWRNNPPG